MDNLQIPLVGPLAPVIGAIVGGLIGAFVTYRIVVKRKALSFHVSESEDLTLALRQHHRFMSFKIGDKEMSNLNRCSVTVRNVGNVSIANVAFNVVIDGIHAVSLAEVSGGSIKLRNEIKIEKVGDNVDPVFNVSMPYLNAKESFEVELYFDGVINKCAAHCRMEDVKVTIYRGKTAIEEALDFGRGNHEATMGALIYEVTKRSIQRLLGF